MSKFKTLIIIDDPGYDIDAAKANGYFTAMLKKRLSKKVYPVLGGRIHESVLGIKKPGQ